MGFRFHETSPERRVSPMSKTGFGFPTPKGLGPGTAQDQPSKNIVDLTLDGVTSSSITFKWSAAYNVLYYKFWYESSPADKGSSAILPGTTGTHTFSGLNPSTTYNIHGETYSGILPSYKSTLIATTSP